MNRDLDQKKIPLLSRTYDIGNSVKLRLTMITGGTGHKDRVLVERLFQTNNSLLLHGTIDDNLFDAALQQFENERLKLIKKHQPNRYKAIIQ